MSDGKKLRKALRKLVYEVAMETKVHPDSESALKFAFFLAAGAYQAATKKDIVAELKAEVDAVKAANPGAVTAVTSVERFVLLMVANKPDGILPDPAHLGVLHTLRDKGLIIAVQPPGQESYKYVATDAGRAAVAQP